MTDSIVPAAPIGTVTRSERDDLPKMGSWFWLLDESESLNAGRLGCVVQVGSNFAELKFPGGGTTRIHLDEWETSTKPEPNAQAVISEKIAGSQLEVQTLLGQVRALVDHLGLSVERTLPESTATGSVLARASGTDAIKTYESGLVLARDKQLPDLFKQIEREQRQTAALMEAQTFPLEAQLPSLHDIQKRIQGRIFNVQLYAGLVEQCVQIRGGVPASRDTPIHLHQRMCFMDEECLAGYVAGGITFKEIGAFDTWLVQPANLARLLPHPRCAVAFRVRRKHQDTRGMDWRDLIRLLFDCGKDMATYLYMRNGDQVWRLSTKLDFGQPLFPDLDAVPTEHTGKLYAKRDFEEYHIIHEGAYLAMLEEDRKAKEAHEAAWRTRSEWEEKYTDRVRKITAALKRKKERPWQQPSPAEIAAACERAGIPPEPPWPGAHYHSKSDEYRPFDSSNVQYDDILAAQQAALDKHNRLALVLQGVLDRSTVFHPHPPWKLYQPADFAAAIVPVYDLSRVLTGGAPPDFEEYRARVNSALRTGSITVGQQDAWERKQAGLYNARNQERRGHTDLVHHRPEGNPGPGLLAVATVSRDRSTCAYSWKRRGKRKHQEPVPGKPGYVYTHRWVHEEVPGSFSLKSTYVLNVSAYHPGDFRQFYLDPRTRERYFEWAPLLLRAEDYHGGKLEVGHGGTHDGDQG